MEVNETTACSRNADIKKAYQREKQGDSCMVEENGENQKQDGRKAQIKLWWNVDLKKDSGLAVISGNWVFKDVVRRHK